MLRGRGRGRGAGGGLALAPALGVGAEEPNARGDREELWEDDVLRVKVEEVEAEREGGAEGNGEKEGGVEGVPP